MSKLFKKISAIVLTAIMVLTMCSAVFADGEGASTGAYPTAADKAIITARNIEANSTVTAYRVVEPVYVNGIGFKEYKKVDNTEISIGNPVAPTAEEIVSIAAKISKGTITGLESVTLTAKANDKTTYTASVGAGYWVVLVTGTPSASKVYNPMLAGVYYSISGTDKTMAEGEVDATKNWTLATDGAYAKSVGVDVSKKITNSTATIKNTSNKSEKGDDLAIGDYATFQIDGTIPAYTEAYTQVTYKITDTTSDGLTLENTADHPVQVTVGGESISATSQNNTGDSAKTYTLTVENHSLVVDFDSAFALEHKGQAVVVTYSAKLNDQAETNFNANTNTVKVTYSNDPKVDSETHKTPTTDTPEDKTYHYTFEIDGNLYGTTTIAGERVTTELTKTGSKSTSTKYTNTTENPLAGAEFTLYKKDGTKVQSQTSDKNGQLNFKGLDAGEYTLKETKAPSPYSLNTTVIPVVITADYNEDGTLNNYNIKIGGESGKTFSYTATYSEKMPIEFETKVNNVDESRPSTTGDKSTYEIKNTPISELPSTGGMGTYIFTIVGVVLMACAAGAFMVSRRRSEN